MNVLLIGHTGFVGKEISKLLIQNKQKFIGLSSKDIDLLSDKSIDILKSYINKKTIIILCSGIKKQLGDTFENFKKNQILIYNFLESCILSKPKSIIYFSSAAIYGEDNQFDHLISEETRLNPKSFYGISKLCSENLLTKFCLENDVSLTILRPPLLYGVFDFSRGYGPTSFTYNALENKEITIWGDGTEMREFIYIGDLARITIDLLNNNQTCILNTVSGTSYNFLEIVNILKNVTNKPLKVNFRQRTKLKTNHNFDNSKLKRNLPNFKFTDLDKGIRKLCEAINLKR